MKITFVNILLYSFFFVTASCGFKVVNKDQIANFKIKEITTIGDKRINFKIKNNLNITANNNNKNVVLITLNTKKDKTIKEKNIKNEITKYEIAITTLVSITKAENGSRYEKTINETGSFSVSKNNSTTLSNERKLSERLSEQLATQITDYIKRIFDDN